jgi:hypothetical protein
LQTSSLSSSWATFSPTYRLSQIADKALIFDGNIALRKLRSCLGCSSATCPRKWASSENSIH